MLEGFDNDRTMKRGSICQIVRGTITFDRGRRGKSDSEQACARRLLIDRSTPVNSAVRGYNTYNILRSWSSSQSTSSAFDLYGQSHPSNAIHTVTHRALAGLVHLSRRSRRVCHGGH